MTCDKCGREIYIGEEVYTFNNTMIKFGKDRTFCSYDCLKEYTVDNLDDLLEDYACCYEAEDSDPYSRYGVSERDFG